MKKDNKVVSSLNDIEKDDIVTITLKDGNIESKVIGKGELDGSC